MSTPRAARQPRRDATANRRRIIDEAEIYFAEEGIDASLHELARRTGVGIGTLYRHFPAHRDLIQALYDRIGERLDEVAVRCEEAPTGWEALETFIDGTTRALLAFPATLAIMQRQASNDPAYRPGTRYEEPLRRHVAHAKEEGALRADVMPTDVAVIPFLLSGAGYYAEPMRGLVLARQRTIMLDGLRAHSRGPTPLPSEPAGVDDFHRAVHGQPAPTSEEESAPTHAARRR